MAFNRRIQAPTYKCEDCGSTEFSSRKNYSHGKSSKARVTRTCAKCNSAKVVLQNNRFRR